MHFLQYTLRLLSGPSDSSVVTTPQLATRSGIVQSLMATGTAATMGRMQELNPDNKSIAAYFEQFKLFVQVNGIDKRKQAPTLLLILGMKHYSLIRDLVSPGKPKDKSLDELTALLTKHYDPEPIMIAEWFHFYQRSQRSGESVSDYLAGLHKLASRCKFGTFLPEALRDRLVCGLGSEAIQKSLLTKDDLTLEKAMEIALSMEAAAKGTKELKGNQRSSSVLRVEQTPPPAWMCGQGNHNSSECKFKGAKCHKCGKVGHITSVCRSKPGKGRPKHAQWLASIEQDCSRDSPAEETLFAVRDKSSCPSYEVELRVNGHPLIMEVDTGADVSIAPESVLASLLPSVKLKKTNVVLKTYTGQPIPVKGSITVNVDYGQQHYKNLKLLVVRGQGSSL